MFGYFLPLSKLECDLHPLFLENKWKTTTKDYAETLLNNFALFRAERAQIRRGGGVAPYIKYSL